MSGKESESASATDWATSEEEAKKKKKKKRVEDLVDILIVILSPPWVHKAVEKWFRKTIKANMADDNLEKEASWGVQAS